MVWLQLAEALSWVPAAASLWTQLKTRRETQIKMFTNRFHIIKLGCWCQPSTRHVFISKMTVNDHVESRKQFSSHNEVLLWLAQLSRPYFYYETSNAPPQPSPAHTISADQKGRQRQLNIHHDQSETCVSLQHPFFDTQLLDYLLICYPPPTPHPVLCQFYRVQPFTGKGCVSHAINPKSTQLFTFFFEFSSQEDLCKISS